MKESLPKVLIVDDEKLYCDLLQAVLSRCGYEVLIAYNGNDAIKLFRQWRPKFTLLDLRLPDIHGIEVLKEIRKIDPEAPVMVLTNWGSDFVESQVRKLGVRDFFSKKMTLDAVMGSLERALKETTEAPTEQAPGKEVVPLAQVPTTKAPAADGTSALSERREGGSILVVDDEPQVLDVVSQFLAQRGYQVRTASSGEKALSLVDQEHPALMILDMYMPGMNGIGVLRQLYERKNTSGIILLTGSQDEKLLAESLDLGVLEIIGKPVNFDHLALAVRLGLQIKNR